MNDRFTGILTDVGCIKSGLDLANLPIRLPIDLLELFFFCFRLSSASISFFFNSNSHITLTDHLYICILFHALRSTYFSNIQVYDGAFYLFICIEDSTWVFFFFFIQSINCSSYCPRDVGRSSLLSFLLQVTIGLLQDRDLCINSIYSAYQVNLVPCTPAHFPRRSSL